MTNNNVQGSNQFGNYQLQPAYGDVKKQTQLTREAPISGSPFSALEAPRRAGRAAKQPPQAQTAPAQEQPGQEPSPEPQVDLSAVYRQIADIPQVTPMWRRLLG